ncbi:MAG: HDOD domain-containing protein [Syntrophobacterales bacterium]|nr:HDOD domain-containing protein [Syntrophobacterales bacterium]
MAERKRDQRIWADRILAQAQRLPPFPDVVNKLMPLLRELASVKQIEEIIKYEPVIAARVLAISRSPYYARLRRVESLRDAIVVLGQKQLIQVVMTACASQYFRGSMEGYELREGELWEHAVGVALMAEILGERLRRQNVLTLYTAGLLHDIGKTVLHFYVKEEFERIITEVKHNKKRFLDAEREVLGIDHEQLGGLIAKKWNFPDSVISGIRFHHEPRRAPDRYRDIANILYVANRMVSSIGIGCGIDGFLNPNRDEVFNDLGITSRMVEEFLATFGDTFLEVKQFILN